MVFTPVMLSERPMDDIECVMESAEILGSSMFSPEFLCSMASASPGAVARICGSLAPRSSSCTLSRATYIEPHELHRNPESQRTPPLPERLLSRPSASCQRSWISSSVGVHPQVSQGLPDHMLTTPQGTLNIVSALKLPDEASDAAASSLPSHEDATENFLARPASGPCSSPSSCAAGPSSAADTTPATTADATLFSSKVPTPRPALSGCGSSA
mmetsp:Transcript_8066/g.30286  ORF Transcript_8066/g.30286 Transcript_8066/m.30286 type:complete len:214 (+) Transcript_8066:553-1194(+)